MTTAQPATVVLLRPAPPKRAFLRLKTLYAFSSARVLMSVIRANNF